MSQETTLAIRGMTCGNCVKHVDAALRAVPGVVAVAVALPGTARVTHTGDRAPLVAAIEKAGYAVE